MTKFKTVTIRFFQSGAFVYLVAGSLIVAGIIASLERHSETISYLSAEERHSRDAAFLQAGRKALLAAPQPGTAEGARQLALDSGWCALAPTVEEGIAKAGMTPEEASIARSICFDAWYALDGTRVLAMLNGELPATELMEEFADRASRIALPELSAGPASRFEIQPGKH